MTRKTVYAYLDGKQLCDVVQAALDNNMTVQAMKTLLNLEHDNKIIYKIEPMK